jgi:hypothetical protein
LYPETRYFALGFLLLGLLLALAAADALRLW